MLHDAYNAGEHSHQLILTLGVKGPSGIPPRCTDYVIHSADRGSGHCLSLQELSVLNPKPDEGGNFPTIIWTSGTETQHNLPISDSITEIEMSVTSCHNLLERDCLDRFGEKQMRKFISKSRRNVRAFTIWLFTPEK